MKLLIAIVFASALAIASANCPSQCSGHGTCGANDKCTCYPNFQGLDCAERKCSFGKAWSDTPSADNVAHGYAECSNKGICDRKSGLCKCFPGYEGEGCRRTTCPNQCSGHGTCEYLEELASDTSMQVGGAAGRLYTLWDGHKIQGCKCDAGFEGSDCSNRKCPIGDDPLTTTNTNKEIQTVTVGDGDNEATTAITGSFTLTYTDLYNGVWTTRPLTAFNEGSTAELITRSETDMALALESLPNHVIEDVVVTSTTTAPNIVYSVTFNGKHTLGPQNLMTCNKDGCDLDGCQPRFAGIGGGATPTCTVAVSQAGTHDTARCSNRGMCDLTTGLCACHTGYTDEDCSTQTVLV